jgi:hypothetical protein
LHSCPRSVRLLRAGTGCVLLRLTPLTIGIPHRCGSPKRPRLILLCHALRHLRRLAWLRRELSWGGRRPRVLLRLSRLSSVCWCGGLSVLSRLCGDALSLSRGRDLSLLLPLILALLRGILALLVLAMGLWMGELVRFTH